MLVKKHLKVDRQASHLLNLRGDIFHTARENWSCTFTESGPICSLLERYMHLQNKCISVNLSLCMLWHILSNVYIGALSESLLCCCGWIQRQVLLSIKQPWTDKCAINRLWKNWPGLNQAGCQNMKSFEIVINRGGKNDQQTRGLLELSIILPSWTSCAM